jgi:hypothetical protein
MTLVIELTPEEEMKLQQRAAESGQNPADYAKGLLARDLERPQSLRDLFAPVREDIQASGVTEEELDALIEEAREEVYQEKLARERLKSL